MKKIAFTLAEMMVVMLILTIILAAFAPLMTKRKNVDLSSSPWRYASNNSDIYYGLGDKQTAMIGQNAKTSTDTDSKLIINTNSTKQAHITFKTAESGEIGSLLMQVPKVAPGDLRMGGPYSKESIEAVGSKGAGNTGFGFYALNNLTTGDGNSAFGLLSLNYNTTGYDNTAMGEHTLRYNTTGSHNTAIGSFALGYNQTAGANTAIGFSALKKNTIGERNTAVGYDAMAYITPEGTFEGENTALGYNSLAGNPDTTNSGGQGNTAIGAWSLRLITTGNLNSALGYKALEKNKNGGGNTAVGASALMSNISGINNVALGNDILHSNTEGSYNTAMGYDSLYSNTKGSYNIAIGYKSLYSNTEGSYNIAIGPGACSDAKGSHKTCIGYYSGPSSADLSTTDIVYLGSSSTSQIISGVSGITTYSDKRLKNVKSEYKNGLEAVRKIVPVKFIYKKDKYRTVRTGVIAQDVEKVLPEAVKKNGDGYLVVEQGTLFYTLLNSVKQLDNIVQGIINELKIIEAKLDTLIKQESAKDKKIKELEKRLEKLEKRSV